MGGLGLQGVIAEALEDPADDARGLRGLAPRRTCVNRDFSASEASDELSGSGATSRTCRTWAGWLYLATAASAARQLPDHTPRVLVHHDVDPSSHLAFSRVSQPYV